MLECVADTSVLSNDQRQLFIFLQCGTQREAQALEILAVTVRLPVHFAGKDEPIGDVTDQYAHNNNQGEYIARLDRCVFRYGIGGSHASELKR